MPKKGGKSKGFISQGIHSNVNQKITNSIRRDYMASGQRLLNQRRAYESGKNVMVTVENPNKNETNRRYIRVPASQVWRSNKMKRN